MTRPKTGLVVLLVATAATSGRTAAQPQAAPSQSRPITVTGKVVDAACYMIHPPAASIPSHKDCGTACLARGVPLAIANEGDGALYFPADGNARLAKYLDQRVTAIGTAMRKNEPMELKMPVGDKNQMTVHVDGGYNVLTIKSIAKTPGRATH